jgi:REP element-mobilizing transposase RayT
MTSPRHEVYDPQQGGTYHCIARCVRRAFLCGYDLHAAKSFEHRRQWVQDRLALLTRVFAVDLSSYAVMSNHFHLVMTLRPEVARSWSEEEVAIRWRRLFPTCKDHTQGVLSPSELALLLSDKNKLESLRLRLSSMSWFMRCLSEWIARRANKEDNCKGRFWEGRYKSQRLEGTKALIACTSYVDLNPVRAKVARHFHDAPFTSVFQRLCCLEKQQKQQSHHGSHSAPVLASLETLSNGALTDAEYLCLLEESRKRLTGDDTEDAPTKALCLTTTLSRLGIRPPLWTPLLAGGFGKWFRRIAGSHHDIKAFASARQKLWFHGIASARSVFQD